MLSIREIPDCGCKFLSDCNCPWRCKKCSWEGPRTGAESLRCPRCNNWCENRCRGVLFHLIWPPCIHVRGRDFQACACGWKPEEEIRDPDSGDLVRIIPWPDIEVEALAACPRCGAEREFFSVKGWAEFLEMIHRRAYRQPPPPLKPMRRINPKKRIAAMRDRRAAGFDIYLPGDWQSGTQEIDAHLDVIGAPLKMTGNWRAQMDGYVLLSGTPEEVDEQEAEQERRADLFAWKFSRSPA